MKNNKWSVESFSAEPIHVVLFVSRNKDNLSIPDFKERRKSFITHKKVEDLKEEFDDFVSHGVDNEMCRMYYSVNARDPQKIYAQLMHFLFDNPEFNLCSISPKLAGIAAQKECRLEKKWMFDFDIYSRDAVADFVSDLYTFGDFPSETVTTYSTPHGYAIVVPHGFDTRLLFGKWNKNVTLKRDDLLCVDWKTKIKED